MRWSLTSLSSRPCPSRNFLNFGYINLGSRLYRNDAKSNNWLKVKLNGVRSDINGIGSRVEVYINGTKMIREIDGGSSHESKNSSIAHFGLKDHNTADSVSINWMGGKIQKLYNLKDRLLEN